MVAKIIETHRSLWKISSFHINEILEGVDIDWVAGYDNVLIHKKIRKMLSREWLEHFIKHCEVDDG